MTEQQTEPFIHAQGLCESSSVGEGTRIWAFTHILKGAKIGKNCNICDHVFIENDVVIGDDVTIKCGVQLWDGLRAHSGVFIGPNVTFTNDKNPRSKVYPKDFAKTILEQGCSIGANATILPGLKIGRDAMIGAGAVVTHDVPAYATVVGNPGKIIGYQGAQDTHTAQQQIETNTGTLSRSVGARLELDIGDSFLERLPNFSDMRGNLMALEKGRGLPFKPARVFLVHGVKSHHVRGEHAHRQCAQFLVAANGSVSIVLDDGHKRAEVRLEDQTVGLYLPPMIWGIQYKFDTNTVLMVLASHPYEDGDYIRDYDVFCELLNGDS